MENKRIGFITPSGLFASLIMFMIVVGFGLARGGILFNPGPLNAQTGSPLGGVASHSQLQGKCAGCHAAFWEHATMADRCIVCHADIAVQRTDTNSLHGIIQVAFAESNCRSCHPEHRGVNALLTVLDEKNFPHWKFGFPLEGKHIVTACSGCHTDNDYSTAPTDCYSCHASSDIHEGKYGTNCAACHTPSSWLKVTFDHSLSAFKLLGKHAPLVCSDCHVNDDFKNTPMDCNACHAKDDQHNGQYGTECGTCHTPTGWLPATFDHSTSTFQLTGQHAVVTCTACHINGTFKGTPTDCHSCHGKDDKHFGQFGTDCSLCHTTSGWLPATFDHNLAAFILTGKHYQVACTDCHVNKIFKGTPTDCYSCHSNNDRHNGQFGRDCGVCHTTSGWLPANFNHSGFPLTGGHAGLACTRCHTNGIYVGLSTACVSCHNDPAFHLGMFGTNCAQCHNTSNWYAPYSGSHPGGCDGNCLTHENATCRDCHTVNLSTATCTKCHAGGIPGDGD